MLIWQIVKGTRVHGYAYDVANDERALSIVFIDRACPGRSQKNPRRARCWKLFRDVYVTRAISHPVVEYICALDIDRCARTRSDIAPTRASLPRIRREPANYSSTPPPWKNRETLSALSVAVRLHFKFVRLKIPTYVATCIIENDDKINASPCMFQRVWGNLYVLSW